MSSLTVFLFGLLLLLLLMKLGVNRKNLFQYPFLSISVLLGWVFPQVINLKVLDDLPSGALERFLIFTGGSALAIYFGYTRNEKGAKVFETWRFSRRRLLLASIFFSIAGHFAWYKVETLAGSVAHLGGAWSGSITIYVFFGRLLSVGMAIALVLHLRKATTATFLILAIDYMFMFEKAFIGFRREEMMELVITTVLFLWWKFRWAPSRMVFVSLIIAGSLVVNTVGALRGLGPADDLEFKAIARAQAISRLDLIEIFSNKFGDVFYGQEVREAALMMEASERYLDFDLGAFYWDRFVHSYVPGQIVGPDLKEALMTDRQNPLERKMSYTRLSNGITHTGMGDAFGSFWYFGIFLFFLMGRIMSKWWIAADSGNSVARMVILLISVKALLSITHTTPEFYLEFVFLSVFLLPVLIFSRVVSRQSRQTPISANIA